MIINAFRLQGIRCFEDTGSINLSPKCNLFVGKNNAGKSTLMQGITSWQLRPFDFNKDSRLDLSPLQTIDISEAATGNHQIQHIPSVESGSISFNGNALSFNGSIIVGGGAWQIFKPNWPNNAIVPFIAKRKATGFVQGISTNEQRNSDGTLTNLYARIDRVVSPGPSAHMLYKKAIEEIVGVFVTTRASASGKEAGFYLDDEHFVPLDQMGDGIAEIVALVVELSLSKNKIFVLEEPETNLHPEGLKALLNLIRESSAHNQFIIATHSNIVVRELASETTKIFRVYRDKDVIRLASSVADVPNTAEAHRDLLRELGYEFSDFGLHEGWLFLEEASAETIFQHILIPWFTPSLVGRLRTFSAAGADNLEPSVSEFQRLIAFVHLQPVYKDRLWVRADGDEKGRRSIGEIQKKFAYLSVPRAAFFQREQFESYFPDNYGREIEAIRLMPKKQDRRSAKEDLLRRVVEWSIQNKETASAAWEQSAAEPIELLRRIEASLK